MRSKVSSFPFSHRMAALEEHCSWVLYWFFCLYTLQNRAPSKTQELLILWLGLRVSRTLHFKKNCLNWKSSLCFRDTHIAEAWNREQFLASPLLLFWLRTVQQCYLVQEGKRKHKEKANWKVIWVPRNLIRQNGTDFILFFSKKFSTVFCKSYTFLLSSSSFHLSFWNIACSPHHLSNLLLSNGVHRWLEGKFNTTIPSNEMT